jgi:hypothetical protein
MIPLGTYESGTSELPRWDERTEGPDDDEDEDERDDEDGDEGLPTEDGPAD